MRITRVNRGKVLGRRQSKISKALAQFVRSIVSFSSAWDADWSTPEQDPEFRSEAAKRGREAMMSLPGPNGGRVSMPCGGCHRSETGVKPGIAGHLLGLVTNDELRNNGLTPL